MNESPAIMARRLNLAYLHVFGDPETRGPDQKLVWQDIESFCYAYRLCREGKGDGDLSNNFDLNEGRRSYWLRARGMIIQAMNPDPSPVIVTKKRKKL